MSNMSKSEHNLVLSTETILSLEPAHLHKVVSANLPMVYQKCAHNLRLSELDDDNPDLILYRLAAEIDAGLPVAELTDTLIRIISLKLDYLSKDLSLKLLRKYVACKEIYNLPYFDVTPEHKAILDTMPCDVYLQVKKKSSRLARHVDTTFDSSVVSRSDSQVRKDGHNLWFAKISAYSHTPVYFKSEEEATSVVKTIDNEINDADLQYYIDMFNAKLGEGDVLWHKMPGLEMGTRYVKMTEGRTGRTKEVLMYVSHEVVPGIAVAAYPLPRYYSGISVGLLTGAMKMKENMPHVMLGWDHVRAEYKHLIDSLLLSASLTLMHDIISIWREVVDLRGKRYLPEVEYRWEVIQFRVRDRITGVMLMSFYLELSKLQNVVQNGTFNSYFDKLLTRHFQSTIG